MNNILSLIFIWCISAGLAHGQNKCQLDYVVIPASCSNLAKGSIQLKNLNELKSVRWSDGSSEFLKTDLEAGKYSLEATFKSGCIEKKVIEVSKGIPFNISIETTASKGKDQPTGSITVQFTSGQSPFAIKWYKGNEELKFNNQKELKNLRPGAYHATFTDAQGCTRVETILVPLQAK